MNLDALTRELRREQDGALSPARRRAVRDRLLSSPTPKAKPARIGWAALAVIALVFAWSTWPGPVAPLTFRVAGEPGTREAFVSAPMTGTMPLTFSDGSRVQLGRGSRARVGALSSRGATVRLEHGHAEVHVIHRDDTDWHVEAGPYTVHVVGTRFAIRWDARSAELEVAMREGRVVIEGPDGFRTTLEDRERLRREGQPPSPRVAPIVEAETESVAQPVEPAVDTAQPDWRALARLGRHTEATRWIRVSQLRSAEDLRLAATTLRRAGDAREDRAWEALHRHGARDAAFHLGRNAFHAGDFAAAERWLDAYLERPGRYEREARGRRLELLARRDDPRARAEAELYLRRFADGPHAELARRVALP